MNVFKLNKSPVWSNLFRGEVRLAVMLLLREDDGENCMGPAAGLIHVGSSNSSACRHIGA